MNRSTIPSPIVLSKIYVIDSTKKRYEEERKRRIRQRGESPDDYYNSRTKKNLGYGDNRKSSQQDPNRPEELYSSILIDARDGQQRQQQQYPSLSSNQPPTDWQPLPGSPDPNYQARAYADAQDSPLPQQIPLPDGSFEDAISPRTQTRGARKIKSADGTVSSWEPSTTSTGGFDNQAYTSNRNVLLQISI